jgi:hypothetical protein
MCARVNILGRRCLPQAILWTLVLFIWWQAKPGMLSLARDFQTWPVGLARGFCRPNHSILPDRFLLVVFVPSFRFRSMGMHKRAPSVAITNDTRSLMSPISVENQTPISFLYCDLDTTPYPRRYYYNCAPVSNRRNYNQVERVTKLP